MYTCGVHSFPACPHFVEELYTCVCLVHGFTDFYTEDMYVNYCSEQSTAAGSTCVHTDPCTCRHPTGRAAGAKLSECASMCGAPCSYPKCAHCMGVGLVGPMSTVYMLCPVHADSVYTRHTLDLTWTHGSMCHEDRTHQRHSFCTQYILLSFRPEALPSGAWYGVRRSQARGGRIVGTQVNHKGTGHNLSLLVPEAPGWLGITVPYL